MLNTTHTLAGATAGRFVPNPVVAFFVGVFLHFVLDKIPHFGPKSKKYKLIMIVVDWSVALLLIVFLFNLNIVNKNSVIAGALGGYLVDWMLVAVPQVHKSKIGVWHSKRQTHLNNQIYYLVDGFVIVLLIGFWGILK